MSVHATARPPAAPSPDHAGAGDRITPVLEYAFAPMHKRAFGMATGAAAALLMALLTLAALVLPTAREFPLGLLNEYFAGYSVSWPGVLIGAGWGFVVGFVAGWFFAFCRNLTLAIAALVITARAEMDETRDFLDHI